MAARTKVMICKRVGAPDSFAYAIDGGYRLRSRRENGYANRGRLLRPQRPRGSSVPRPLNDQLGNEKRKENKKENNTE